MQRNSTHYMPTLKNAIEHRDSDSLPRALHTRVGISPDRRSSHRSRPVDAGRQVAIPLPEMGPVVVRVRESIEAADDRACEVLTQTGSCWATAFFFVHRIWKLTRRGRYNWTKVGGRWRINRVEVIEEHLSGRFHFGSVSSIETGGGMAETHAPYLGPEFKTQRLTCGSCS